MNKLIVDHYAVDRLIAELAAIDDLDPRKAG